MADPDVTDPTVYPLTGTAQLEGAKRRFAVVCNIVALNTGGRQGLWTSERAVTMIYSHPASHTDTTPRSCGEEAAAAMQAAADAGTLYRYGDRLTIATDDRLHAIVANEADTNPPDKELIGALNTHLSSSD
jgi:hypothetical protein